MDRDREPPGDSTPANNQSGSIPGAFPVENDQIIPSSSTPTHPQNPPSQPPSQPPPTNTVPPAPPPEQPSSQALPRSQAPPPPPTEASPNQSNTGSRFIDSRVVSALNTLFGPGRASPTRSFDTFGPPTGLHDLIDDSTDINNGSIVITINYVFSDENNPVNPNRTGSLVLTLPNNPSNRNPRMLDEFIRLATQIAYTAIVNGMQKEKKFMTTKQFKSFPICAHVDLQQRDCSICLETYEKYTDPSPKPEPEKSFESATNKRRKLDKDATFVATDSTFVSTDAPNAEGTHTTGSTNTTTEFLKDCSSEFPHIPVKLPCNHVFGQSCLSEWLKLNLTCPLCRTVIPVDDGEGTGATDGIFGRSAAAATNTATATGENDTNNTSDASQPLNNLSNAPNVRVVDRSGDEFRFLLHNGSGIVPENIPSAALNAANAAVAASTASTTIPAPPPPPANPSRAHSLGRQSIFNNIRDYFRVGENRNDPLFPTSVESRRTANGVNTTSSDDNFLSASMPIPIIAASTSLRPSNQTDLDAEEVLDFLNLRSLTDPEPTRTTPAAAATTTASTATVSAPTSATRNSPRVTARATRSSLRNTRSSTRENTDPPTDTPSNTPSDTPSNTQSNTPSVPRNDTNTN